ncbi:MAG: carboxymuconolactone decarboxylase family protein [Rhodospirillaceae bacterium]
MKSYPEIASDLSRGMEDLSSAMPATMGVFSGLVQETTAAGALDSKTKELIALAIAACVRCDPCIAHHGKAVAEAGVSREEVAEALGIAILMGGGPAVAYSVAALEAFDQFNAPK